MKHLLFFLLAGLFSAGCTPQSGQNSDSTKVVAVPPPVTPPAASNAPPAQPPGDHRHSCTKGKDTRELEVIKKNDGCILSYTEDGKTKKKASDPHGLARCESSEKKLIAKLEKTGFTCN